METDEIIGIKGPGDVVGGSGGAAAAGSASSSHLVDDELGVCEDQENCTSQEERRQAAARYGESIYIYYTIETVLIICLFSRATELLFLLV